MMVNPEAIAEHLESLRLRAMPYSISDHGVIAGGTAELTNNRLGIVDHALAGHIEPILSMSQPAVDEAELVAAATECRKANMGAITCGPHWWRQPIPWETTKRLYVYALPQLRAAIAAWNAARKDEYERYRMAVMQGVAIAPPS